jgi:glyoxylase-like metal-dependent hydrolase (beta-lactamase superfamily II)
MNPNERLHNIYVIDTKMFDFDRYMSAYIVAGKEIALIDTGLPSQIDAVRAGIRAHGFAFSDISHIFITHSHPDHSGNVAPILKENPGAMVYIHPLGVGQLLDPSIELAIRKKALPAKMHAKIGEMEPVPAERIRRLNDGDAFDLGDGEKLRAIFAPGHQPDGVIFYEEKNKGLFINDLVGNYFADAGAHYPLNPPNSDPQQTIASLQKLAGLPLKYLYMGHYGISDKPKEVIAQSIAKVRQLLDIGTKYINEGKPEKIADAVYAVIIKELEKLRKVRGEEIYEYAAHNHVSSQARLFAQYCLENLNK